MQFYTLAEVLRAGGKRLPVAAGQVLFTEGQADARVFLVESGSFDIEISSREGQRLILNVLRPGDVFGEIAMLDGGPRTADAVARTDSCVIWLSRHRFFSLFPGREEAYEYVVQLLCQRLRWTNRRTEHSSLCTARALLAGRLQMMAGEGSADWINASQEEIACGAGITREYGNRLLRELRVAGIIEQKRGGVRIVRWDALSELADASD